MDWLKELPPVPKEIEIKRVDMTLINIGMSGRGYWPMQRDATVPILPEGYEWDSNFSMNVMGFHPHATYGIRSKSPTSGGSGNQAMYDARGKLITGGLSAGTADKTSPNPHNIMAHRQNDVVPFNWASDLDKYYGGKKFRYMYLEVRPPNCPKEAPENIVD